MSQLPPPLPNNRTEPTSDPPPSVSPQREAYNLVTDLGTGINVRRSDNVLQALFILGTVLLGSVIGAILAALFPRWNLPWFIGAMIGAFGGLVFGFFASGFFLMIYRGVRHLEGKHD